MQQGKQCTSYLHLKSQAYGTTEITLSASVINGPSIIIIIILKRYMKMI